MWENRPSRAFLIGTPHTVWLVPGNQAWTSPAGERKPSGSVHESVAATAARVGLVDRAIRAGTQRRRVRRGLRVARHTGAVSASIVAVPGLGLGVEAWRGVLARWGVGEEAVRLLPGYGLPVEPAGARSPAELARVLCDGLSAPTTLLGHSASCQVVAHAARLRPDLVSRLVLVGPATDPRARSWPGLAALWLRTAVHEDPRQVPLLVRQYRRTTLRSMLATMDVARRDDLAATLSEVGCPVVLVRGAHDRIARRDWLWSLAGVGTGEGAGAGGGRQVVELGAGAHMVPLTHPGLLARALSPALG